MFGDDDVGVLVVLVVVVEAAVGVMLGFAVDDTLEDAVDDDINRVDVELRQWRCPKPEASLLLLLLLPRLLALGSQLDVETFLNGVFVVVAFCHGGRISLSVDGKELLLRNTAGCQDAAAVEMNDSRIVVDDDDGPCLQLGRCHGAV